MLIAEEDKNQREINAYNYIDNEINDKIEPTEMFSPGRSPHLNIEQTEEESIDRVDVYDDEDMFGYSYFNTFPNFDSFKINF